MIRALLFVCLVGLGWLAPPLSPSASAGIPQTLNYQGFLANAADQPLGNPTPVTLGMTFKLFSSPSGGGALYTESQSVSVSNGVFSVQIGASSPITLPFDVPYFLEITIGAETLSPRQPLASSAYALRTGCNPGDRMACYTGATGSPGVGLCQTGVRVCNAQGTGYGACVGEVTPNCGSTCVNLQSDNSNCGVCGNVCAGADTCGGGGVPGQCGHPAAVCGNGIVEAGEACDDGNMVNGDGCSNTCTVEVPATPVCGNGLLEAGEACDDGNMNSFDGCTSSCQVQAGYACTGMPSICTGICGDGIRVGSEQCDGADLAGQSCSSQGYSAGTLSCGPSCTLNTSACFNAVCGNGTVEPGEACDDGNTTDGDGCSLTCQVQSGFTCTGSPSVCTADPVCGNGIIEAGEACDDGNTVSGDGCSAVCQVQSGYACSGLPSVCTPLNSTPNPVCSSNQFLGTVSGDTGAAILSTTGVGEKWFRVRITEDDLNDLVTPTALKARIQLTVPPGMDYDLHFACLSCGTLKALSQNGVGVTETIDLGRADTVNVDSSFDILIEILYFSGTSTAPWTLTVFGNTGNGTNACTPAP